MAEKTVIGGIEPKPDPDTASSGINAGTNTEMNTDIYFNCRLYPQSRPRIGEHVHITYTELCPDYGVKATLSAYNDCEGTIYLAELTRKKQIKSLSKECPIGKSIIAEVIQSEPNFIGLSKRNLVPSDQEKHMEWFSLSKRMHAVLRKIAFRQKIPLLDLCTGVSWPLYERVNTDLDISERIAQHPYNVLLHIMNVNVNVMNMDMNVKNMNKNNEDPSIENEDGDKDILKHLPNINKEYIEYLLANHEELFGSKSYTESFTAQIMSYGMNGIADIRNTFSQCLALESKYETKLDIAIDECPKYTFKFTGMDQEKVKEHVNEAKAILETFKKYGFYQLEQ